MEAGLSPAAVWHFDDVAAAMSAVPPMLRPQDLVLIKASRGMQLLAPEMQAIQKKYKGKKDQLSQQAMIAEQRELVLPYRGDRLRGDDLRRVHWRSSARVGELMVRREEQPWEAYATVLLDNRADAHRGNGRASSFESAVIAAASAVVHLEQHGYTIQLVTTDGVCVAGCEQALHRLALAEETTQSTMDVNWSGDRARGGIVVGILGDFLPGDSGACRRIRHDAGAALALVVDVEQWSSTRQASVTASPLLALGWRATTIGPRDRLDTAWRDLGRAPARARAGR